MLWNTAISLIKTLPKPYNSAQEHKSIVNVIMEQIM